MSTTPFDNLPPVDYAAAATRYDEEAKDPALTPIEKQAKQDVADFARQRAAEVIGQPVEHDTIPTLAARQAMKAVMRSQPDNAGETKAS